MIARYKLRILRAGVEIYDTTTGNADTGKTVFGPTSYDEAKSKVVDLNNPPPAALAPAAARCDCAAQVAHNKRALLRLADGIEAIATSLYADHQTTLLRALQEARAIIRGEG